MEIRLAVGEDKLQVIQYDSHIPQSKAVECIEDQRVYILQDEQKVVGVLRYSLFWQTIPFLDLLFIDEACRGNGYGTRMMAHWEAAMGRLGYKYVMLST